MRKIVGFKISVRFKEIQRRAKKAKVDLASLTLGDIELQALCDETLKAVKPAVVFDTFSQADPEHSLLSPMPGLAYSLVLATLGEKYEQLEASKPELASVWPLVREHALEETVRFATALLEDEAKTEACELSPITLLNTAEAFEHVVRKLEGAKIGVSLVEGKLVPAASAACSLSWLSKSKAKGKQK